MILAEQLDKKFIRKMGDSKSSKQLITPLAVALKQLHIKDFKTESATILCFMLPQKDFSNHLEI